MCTHRYDLVHSRREDHTEEEVIIFNMTEADASMEVNMLSDELVEVVHDAHNGPDSDVERIIASTHGEQTGPDPDLMAMQFDGPPSPAQRSPSHGSPSHGAPSIPFSAFSQVLNEKAVERDGLAVIVPPPRDRWEYKIFQEADEVKEILEEYDDAGFLEYLVLFADGSEDVVSVALSYLSLTHTISAPSLFYLPPLTSSSTWPPNATCHPSSSTNSSARSFSHLIT